MNLLSFATSDYIRLDLSDRRALAGVERERPSSHSTALSTREADSRRRSRMQLLARKRRRA